MPKEGRRIALACDNSHHTEQVHEKRVESLARCHSLEPFRVRACTAAWFGAERETKRETAACSICAHTHAHVHAHVSIYPSLSIYSSMFFVHTRVHRYTHVHLNILPVRVWTLVRVCLCVRADARAG